MTAAADTIDRAAIVAAARGWIGTPYRHQASVKGVGTDCLGLVRGVWREVMGVEPETPPAYTADWAESGGAEEMADAARRHMNGIACGEAREGDVVLFRMRANGPAKHAAILTARDRMVHAWSGRAVVETGLGRWWRSRMACAFSFPAIEG